MLYSIYMFRSLPLGRYALMALFVWFVANLFGHFSIEGIPKFYSETCFGVFGCNPGFYGLDGYVHLIFGVSGVFMVLFVMYNFPFMSLLRDRVWRDFFIILSMAALIAVSWELLEFASDQYRTVVLHQDLITTHKLAQPTNADTVGDMFYQMLGATLTYITLVLYHRKY